MSFILQINGDKKLIAAVGQLSRGMGKEAERAMMQSILFVHGQMPAYPAPPAGSSYRRTGTLGRTVTSLAGKEPSALSRVEPVGGGGPVRGFVGTRLSYAPHVIGRRTQAWMHRGRWWTLEEVVERSREGIIRIWQAALRAFVDRSVR